jgi:hypothetical protein
MGAPDLVLRQPYSRRAPVGSGPPGHPDLPGRLPRGIAQRRGRVAGAAGAHAGDFRPVEPRPGGTEPGCARAGVRAIRCAAQAARPARAQGSDLGRALGGMTGRSQRARELALAGLGWRAPREQPLLGRTSTRLPTVALPRLTDHASMGTIRRCAMRRRVRTFRSGAHSLFRSRRRQRSRCRAIAPPYQPSERGQHARIIAFKL